MLQAGHPGVYNGNGVDRPLPASRGSCYHMVRANTLSGIVFMQYDEGGKANRTTFSSASQMFIMLLMSDHNSGTPGFI